MAAIRITVGDILQQSISVNTATAYRQAINAFNRFRRAYRIALIWPATAEQIVLFISYCFEKGYAPATISTYVAGVSYLHKLNGWYNPQDIFCIKKLLEGCRRTRGQSDTRAPVTPTMLRNIGEKLQIVCYDRYEALMFKTAYLITYYGLMRVSEVVHTSPNQTTRPLQRTDIRFPSTAAIEITIRISKTNQRPVTLKIPCEPEAEHCPVCTLNLYCKARGEAPGNLFIHKNGRPLTRSQFASVLALTVRQAGYSTAHIKTHSFRIGRASELTANGVKHETIQKMGRWQSSASKRYIRN